MKETNYNVYVCCNHHLQKYDEAPIDFYLDCMRNSDGSEKNRYTNIYTDLLDGSQYAYDDDPTVYTLNFSLNDISFEECLELRKHYKFMI